MYEEIDESRRTEKREESHDEGEGQEAEVVSFPRQKRDNHPNEDRRQKKDIAIPVCIEDLFKIRSLKACAAKSDVRKVLLYGNPGSGKTCISKLIAHKWALGEAMKEFKAIYVVSVKYLNSSKAKGFRGETLEDVVLQMCLKPKENDAEYEHSKTQVRDDLNAPSTLLIFDGFDEADDDVRELFSVVEERSCKLLILTRPYNLQGMQARVDIEFECLGFNDEQLRNFMNEELLNDEALRLITESLHENRAMWEIVHVPVAAHIFCSMSKKRGTVIKVLRKKASMFRIYDDMANFVWKRFQDEYQTEIDKAIFFKDLEKVAFEALKSGQVLIEEELVEGCSTRNSRIMRQSGFLLRALEDGEYQFSHKTFQEFFAGRYIARCLQEESRAGRKRVEGFIRGEKYIEKHTLTTSFAMHALAKACKEEALKDMFPLLDEQPVELLGVQHLFLKMRVLEACLEEADRNDLDLLLRQGEARELIESARKLLMTTIDNGPIRQIVVERFEQCSNVLEKLPRVFEDVVKEVKQLLASGRDWKGEKAKIRDVLKLAERSPEHNNGINEWRLKLRNTDNDLCCTMEGMKRVASIASAASRRVQDLPSTLEREWGNEETSVRRKAKAIGKVLKLQPRELNDLSMMMESRCIGRDFCVLHKVMETIGCILETMPQFASNLLPMLEMGCSDDDSDVCETARRILDGVKPEKIVPPTIAPRGVNKGGLLLLFALKAFTVGPSGKSEKATLLVHSTVLQEIGKWERKELEKYIKNLRQRFEGKFPRLLDCLGTKE